MVQAAVLARTAVRVTAGLALLAGGVLALTGAVAAWVVGGHRVAPPGGVDGAAFTTTLAPVHTDGYAIVVSDVGAVLARHGVARLLGDGRLTISVRSTSLLASDMVVAALVPAPDAGRYLLGTAHAEVLAVGYATGAQPVQVVDRPGSQPSDPAPWESGHGHPLATTAPDATLGLDVPASPVALVVRRADRTPDLTVTIMVGFAPASWDAATAVMSLGGLLAVVTGLALLLLRRPRLDWTDDLTADVLPPAEAAFTTADVLPPAEAAFVIADEEPAAGPVRPASSYVYTAT